jgi:hypothetical protein
MQQKKSTNTQEKTINRKKIYGRKKAIYTKYWGKNPKS